MIHVKFVSPYGHEISPIYIIWYICQLLKSSIHIMIYIHAVQYNVIFIMVLKWWYSVWIIIIYCAYVVLLCIISYKIILFIYMNINIQ